MVTSTVQVQGTFHITTSNGLKKDFKYRTCCDCCHITIGTVFLGIIELIAVSILLLSLIQQVLWKHNDSNNCLSNPTFRMLRDCLLFNFSHFKITLAGDYFIALLMMSILFCIILLFCGILSATPSLLFPHIIIQGIGLISSIAYFVLYAWSYVYGDLYQQKKLFNIQSCVERMWFATILLIFSGFQLYLFFTVIKCSLYLQMINDEQYRKFNQFEQVRQRVKLAKENGLWRSGGGFLQYRGQEEDELRKKEKKQNKKSKWVQWNLEKIQEREITDTNTESEDDFKRHNLSDDVSKKNDELKMKTFQRSNDIKETFNIPTFHQNSTFNTSEKPTNMGTYSAIKNDTQSRYYLDNNNSSTQKNETTHDNISNSRNKQNDTFRTKTQYTQQHKEIIKPAIHNPVRTNIVNISTKTRNTSNSSQHSPVVKKVSISSTSNHSNTQ
uniref:MARVEL domain-containing protein n=2 Tax=Strongyloides stercoralis TaxID=6248 RepID=A0A0K0EQ22_STRER